MYFKRRITLYSKCILIVLLTIFYFVFLFRESLHAFEVSKGGGVRSSGEHNQRIIKPKQQKRHKLTYQDEQKRLQDDENRYKADEKKRFAIDEDDSFSLSKKSPTKLSIITPASSTLNPVYEYSEELHSAIEKKLMQRKFHLHNVCNHEHLFGIYPPKSQEFFVSSGHNLVWCNVFKAASSTWMYYFNLLGGYDIKYLQRTKMSPLELARIHFPRPKLQELQDAISTSLSFLIVREPFERLLSAYRDKLEGCRNKFYKVLSKQIIKLFRKNSQMKRHNSGPTFKEFLLFLIRNSKLKKKFDEHWTPIYSFCTPCSINYTLIAKVETFQRDSEYIIRQAGLEPLLLGKLPKKKLKTISNQATHKTVNLIEKYFSKIDRTTLNELLKIYRLDFELFGYNYTKYYDIVEQQFQSSTPTSVSIALTSLPSSSSSSSSSSSPSSSSTTVNNISVPILLNGSNTF